MTLTRFMVRREYLNAGEKQITQSDFNDLLKKLSIISNERFLFKLHPDDLEIIPDPTVTTKPIWWSSKEVNHPSYTLSNLHVNYRSRESRLKEIEDYITNMKQGLSSLSIDNLRVKLAYVASELNCI